MAAAKRPLRLVAANDTAFAGLMRSERARRGLTQAQVAKAIGVRTQTVSDWELARKTPQPRFHEKIAYFLNLADHTDTARLLGKDIEIFDGTASGRAVRDEPEDVDPGADASAEVKAIEAVSHYITIVGRELSPEEVHLLQTLIDRSEHSRSR